jgi:ADP-ribosyl-[dinitrogen reductase] hydrolase
MRDAAVGAVLGALVGDAAGAVLEFEEGPLDVDRAMTMPGGGTWRVAPGQITDDGELTMSLLRALAGGTPAAVMYAEWIASRPFDIGATTMRSLGCRLLPDVDVATQMTAAAAKLCMDSKANGSLMRATPLGVWGAARTDDETAAAAAADARLSHPNPSCVSAAQAYVVAIASLIRSPNDVPCALAAASRFATGEVAEWLAEARAGVEIPYEPMIGYVRIAFTHAFRHLARGTSYPDALRETLAGGGDTDTNACIVGGLLGARWGADAIPESMRAAVLSCDTSRGAHPRPASLHPRDVRTLVSSLLT